MLLVGGRFKCNGFVQVCRRRGLKVNAGKSMVMVLNGEEGLLCEVSLDGVRLESIEI